MQRYARFHAVLNVCFLFSRAIPSRVQRKSGIRANRHPIWLLSGQARRDQTGTCGGQLCCPPLPSDLTRGYLTADQFDCPRHYANHSPAHSRSFAKPAICAPSNCCLAALRWTARCSEKSDQSIRATVCDLLFLDRRPRLCPCSPQTALRHLAEHRRPPAFARCILCPRSAR